MSSSLNDFLDMNEFSDFNLISRVKLTTVATAQLKYSPHQKYIFKMFSFFCTNPGDQKVILDTFYKISNKKNQYLLSYQKLSFSFISSLIPTFVMKYIPSKTLEEYLKSPHLLYSWKLKKYIQCIFAVCEAMRYLHDHLIIHGNLCPSNIIIDESDQFYVCDFGLFPIKDLYCDEKNMFNREYKDPSMIRNKPSIKNDIYSFGILMCQLFLIYFKISEKNDNDQLDHHLILQEFINNSDPDKYSKFPKKFADLISKCLNPLASERPSFNQIIEELKNMQNDTLNLNISELYTKFINNNYLLNLADKGNEYAINKIGKMYEKGDLFEQSRQKALEFYKKGAELNNSESQFRYGSLLHQKDENDEEIIKGTQYLQKSAEQGNIHGMAHYGVALLNGRGVERNIQKAEDYLKKSADLGYSYAQSNYGFMLLNNNPTIPDMVKGLKFIKKAIDQDDSDAYYKYAVLLKRGQCVDKNDELAMEYFKRSADKGNSEAMFEFAEGNENGIGVEKNEEVALDYYKLAAEKGNKLAIDKVMKLEKAKRKITLVI